jgi:RNA polymerase sigma factor (sigma-70 family)
MDRTTATQFDADLFNNHDKAQFEFVYKTLFPPVYYFAKRFVSYDDARDITAEVFEKIWNMKKSFKTLQNIKTYLHTAVRNSCYNHKAHQLVIQKNTITDGPLTDVQINEFKYEDEINLRKLSFVYAEINKLPKQQKRIFELFYLAGLKEREIAQQLDIAEANVHNQKLAAKKKLRLKFYSGV